MYTDRNVLTALLICYIYFRLNIPYTKNKTREKKHYAIFIFSHCFEFLINVACMLVLNVL